MSTFDLFFTLKYITSSLWKQNKSMFFIVSKGFLMRFSETLLRPFIYWTNDSFQPGPVILIWDSSKS